MTRPTYAGTLDRLLTPLGFCRVENPFFPRDTTWSRIRGDIQEDISLQISSIAGTTANLSSRNLATQRLIDEAIPGHRPGFNCWISTRIGTLIDGRDRWWKGDPKGPKELAKALENHAQTFFDRWFTLEQQAVDRDYLKTKWGGARSRVVTALTLYQLGEKAEACEILSMTPPNTAVKRGVDEYYQLRRWMGCEPSP